MDQTTTKVDLSMLDEIGPWAERKYGILQDYALRYSIVLTQARNKFDSFAHDYIDGYAGTGLNRCRGTNKIVKGTALKSLDIEPPFRSHIFVELSPEKHAILRTQVGNRPGVELFNADANIVLPETIFPRYRWGNYRRAFCLLDPYQHKHLAWETIVAAADTQAIDLLLHFPTMTMNRGVLHRAGEFSAEEASELTRFWGDDSWRSAAYLTDGFLADLPPVKADDQRFALSFCERLRRVAGFKGTSKPIPMKNSKGATLYYLIFAGHHDTALKKMRETASFFIQHPYAKRRQIGPSSTDVRQIV